MAVGNGVMADFKPVSPLDYSDLVMGGDSISLGDVALGVFTLTADWIEPLEEPVFFVWVDATPVRAFVPVRRVTHDEAQMLADEMFEMFVAAFPVEVPHPLVAEIGAYYLTDTEAQRVHEDELQIVGADIAATLMFGFTYGPMAENDISAPLPEMFKRAYEEIN